MTQSVISPCCTLENVQSYFMPIGQTHGKYPHAKMHPNWNYYGVTPNQQYFSNIMARPKLEDLLLIPFSQCSEQICLQVAKQCFG